MSKAVKRTLLIVNEKGLHARASARFVSVTEAHDARATVRRDGLEVSGDSIMGLMMLAASPGCTIDIEAAGADAPQAMDALVTLIGNRFNEDE